MVKRIKCTEEDVKLIVSILEFWGEYSVRKDDPIILEDDGYITWNTISTGSNVLGGLISEGFSFFIDASLIKGGFIKITFSRWE